MNLKIFEEIMSFQQAHNLEFCELMFYASKEKPRWFRFLSENRNCALVVSSVNQRKLKEAIMRGDVEEIAYREREIEDAEDFLLYAAETRR